MEDPKGTWTRIVCTESHCRYLFFDFSSHLAAFFGHLHAALHRLSQQGVALGLPDLLGPLQLSQASWGLLEESELLVDEVLVGEAAGAGLGTSHDAGVAKLAENLLALLAGVELLLLADLLGKERSAGDGQV